MFHWRELVYYWMLFLLTALLMCELKLLWRSVYIKIYSLCRYALTNIFLCFLCYFNINIVVFNTHFFISWRVQCCCLLLLFLLSPERKSVTDVWAEAVVTICLYKNIFSMQTQSSVLLLLFTDTQHNADHRNIRLHTQKLTLWAQFGHFHLGV